MRNNSPDNTTTKYYNVKKAHRFFGVADRLVRREIRSGNTVTMVTEVDLTELEEIRTTWEHGPKPTYTAFVTKAAALALKEYPYANRRLHTNKWIPFSGVKLQQFNCIDIAIACERSEPGVEVATFIDIFREADQRSLSQTTKWLHDLGTSDLTTNKQWRDFMSLITKCPVWLSAFIVKLPLSSPWFWYKWRGGPILISSPAKYGIDVMLGSWPSPLGVSFGFAKERAVVKNGAVVACRTFSLSLNFDRRIMAGAQAARFFKRYVDILENPQQEMKHYLK